MAIDIGPTQTRATSPTMPYSLPSGDIYLNGHCALLALNDIHGGLWHIYKISSSGKHIVGDRLHVVNDRNRAIEWIEANHNTPAPK